MSKECQRLYEKMEEWHRELEEQQVLGAEIGVG